MFVYVHVRAHVHICYTFIHLACNSTKRIHLCTGNPLRTFIMNERCLSGWLSACLLTFRTRFTISYLKNRWCKKGHTTLYHTTAPTQSSETIQTTNCTIVSLNEWHGINSKKKISVSRNCRTLAHTVIGFTAYSFCAHCKIFIRFQVSISPFLFLLQRTDVKRFHLVAQKNFINIFPENKLFMRNSFHIFWVSENSLRVKCAESENFSVM